MNVGAHKNAVAAVKTAVSGTLQEVEALRANISTLTEERAGLDRQSVALDEAVARLDAWLDSLNAKPMSGISLRPLTTAKGEGRLDISPRSNVDYYKTMPLLFAACRPAIRAYLVEQLEREYANAPGLASADRKKRRAELDGQILELSLKEEALIRASEGLRFKIPRRGDADPRAVLAHDSALNEMLV